MTKQAEAATIDVPGHDEPIHADPKTVKLIEDAISFSRERREVIDQFNKAVADSKTWATRLYEADVRVVDIANIFGVNRQQVYKWLGMKPAAK